MSTADADQSVLRGVYRRYRGRVSLTYVLVLLEQTFELLYPAMIGLAIDGLLAGNTMSLAPFVAVWAVHTAVGFFRQMYDTRVFTAMYTDLASGVVKQQRGNNLAVSAVIARSALSREFVDFAETQVPTILSSLLALVGSFVMLLLYDAPSALFCTLLILPLIAVNWWYARRSYKLNTELNDQQEREVSILGSGDHAAVRRHYGLLRKWEVKLSDAEARNWALIEVFVIALSVVVFIRATSITAVQAGTIYAIISYLRNFVESLDQLPTIVQQVTRLVDIARRIRPGASHIEDTPGDDGPGERHSPGS